MRKINIFIFIFLLGVLGACDDDILNKTPLDQYSPDNFYNNESEARMALMGVYNGIIPNHNSLQWYQFEFMSDNTSGMDWTGSLEFGAWNQNSSSVTAETKWAHAYRGIGRANKFIENMENADLEEELKTTMIAEARFIRAYFYADLIHYYSDVPLILETPTLEEAEVPRTSEEDVLEQVIEDFDYAAENLPLEYSSDETGRATKGAALAFKARALLYSEDYEEAAIAAKEVMDLDHYGLFDDYKGLFEEANENNEEVIFDIQYISDLQPQPWPSSALVFGEWPTGSVTLSLIDSYYMTNGLPIDDPLSGYEEQDPYTDRDPRLADNVVLPGSQFGSSILIPDNMEQVQGVTGARTRKYADLQNSDKNNCAINTILMRYADILLMRAEALIESGSTDQEIYDLINQVRQRQSVDMPAIEDVEGTGLSQEELREIVRHERRVEFFMEGTRYADMLRWKDESLIHDTEGYALSKLSDPDNPEDWVFERITVDSREFDPEKGWLWPIPRVERQNNPELTQNDGY